jgi:hydrogenase small subunit
MAHTTTEDGLYAAMLRRGVSRRTFLKFSAAMATALALPASYGPRIASAVAEAPRLPLVWLRGQDCGGNTTAFLHAAQPPITELILEILSVEYHETIMAVAGTAATDWLRRVRADYPDGYIAVVEGGIPTAADGAHCVIGGRPFHEIVKEVAADALVTIAVGACAFDGGISAADGGETGSSGAAGDVPGDRLICLPGCPVNVENLTATIVHYLTFEEWPPVDARHRPYFAYGSLIHNQCERRPHYEYGRYVQSWGDEGAQKGWCLYKMGCKGPEVFADCPTVEYASGTSWPVRAGNGCIGCHMPDFWDAMLPSYRRLPPPLFAGPTLTVDQVGLFLAGAVVGGTAIHGAASYARDRYRKGRARRRARAAESPVAEAAEAETTEAGASVAVAAVESGAVAEPVAAAEPPAPGREAD